MPATTMGQMQAGRVILRQDPLLVRIISIDLYEIRDLRRSTDGREGSFKWTQYDYDTARTTFNTGMADLSS